MRLILSPDQIEWDKSEEKFRVTAGPPMPAGRFGHCATLTPDNKVEIEGCFPRPMAGSQLFSC